MHILALVAPARPETIEQRTVEAGRAASSCFTPAITDPSENDITDPSATCLRYHSLPSIRHHRPVSGLQHIDRISTNIKMTRDRDNLVGQITMFDIIQNSFMLSFHTAGFDCFLSQIKCPHPLYLLFSTVHFQMFPQITCFVHHSPLLSDEVAYPLHCCWRDRLIDALAIMYQSRL